MILTYFLFLTISSSQLLKAGKVVTSSTQLSSHWQTYKMKYASFPTTTHFVERSVKVYNFCSNKSRSEQRVSQLAVCYNIIHDVNHLTKELTIEARKESGKQAYKNEGNIKAGGKARNKTLLQNVLNRHTNIEWALTMFPQLKATYNDIADSVKHNGSSSFKTERQNDNFEKAKVAMTKTRKPNKTEIKKGVHYTPAIRNQVRFHKVKANQDEDGIKLELLARQFAGDFSPLTNITKLKAKLKEVMISKGENEDGQTNPKEIKYFSVKSDYNWSHAVM